MMLAPVKGKILALDLGVSTGFAVGAPGRPPRSGVVILKKGDEDMDVALGNLLAFMVEMLQDERPELVMREAILPLAAFKQMNVGERTVYAHAGYHGIVKASCKRFKIYTDDVKPAVFRKHFIGRANCGDREQTKQATVERCHLLGLMPRECRDDNRADSIAIHDWASATFGRMSAAMAELHLFGEKPQAPGGET